MGIGYWCDGIDGIVKLIAINSSIPGKIYFVSMMGRPHHGENVGKIPHHPHEMASWGKWRQIINGFTLWLWLTVRHGIDGP